MVRREKMEKLKVLVTDSRNKFLKIFGKELAKELILAEDPFRLNGCAQIFKYRIYVVYNKTELTEFLSLRDKKAAALFCLLDGREKEAAIFLKHLSDLFILEGYKTNKRIGKELKLYFSSSSFPDRPFDASGRNLASKQQPSLDFFKAVVFFR